MKRKSTTNDTQRNKQLKQLTRFESITTPNGRSIFEETIKARFHETSTRFEAILEARNGAITARRQHRAVMIEATGILAQMIRNTWNTIAYRVGTSQQPTHHLVLYGLNPDGTRPDAEDSRDWIAHAEKVINADNESEAQGHEPLSEPNRETIQEQIDATEGATMRYEQTVQDLKAAQTGLKVLREEADDLIQEAVYAIRVAHRRESPTAQRATMRILGFRFETETESVNDPETEPIETS